MVCGVTAVFCVKWREEKSNNSDKTNNHKGTSEDEDNDEVPDNHFVLIYVEYRVNSHV